MRFVYSHLFIIHKEDNKNEMIYSFKHRRITDILNHVLCMFYYDGLFFSETNFIYQSIKAVIFSERGWESGIYMFMGGLIQE